MDGLGEGNEGSLDGAEHPKIIKQAQIRKSTFIVKGMTCAACSGTVENHLSNSVAGV